MTDTQVPSDSLSSLKTLAALAAHHGKDVSGVNASMLLALIECAEVMRTAYIYLVRDDRQKALKALTVLEQA